MGRRGSKNYYLQFFVLLEELQSEVLFDCLFFWFELLVLFIDRYLPKIEAT
jgi:hypothetical protein